MPLKVNYVVRDQQITKSSIWNRVRLKTCERLVVQGLPARTDTGISLSQFQWPGTKRRNIQLARLVIPERNRNPWEKCWVIQLPTQHLKKKCSITESSKNWRVSMCYIK